MREQVDALVERVNRGESPGALAHEAGALGMEAALAAAEHLDPAWPARCEALYELIAVAGRSRRMHPELLRLYDPAAWRTFHTEAGRADQKQLGAGLAWPDWPKALAAAAVRAAPEAALDWLLRQAVSAHPEFAHLREVLREWGWWVRVGHERRYAAALDEAASALAASVPVVRDAPTRGALLKFIGDVRASGALPFVRGSLQIESAEVRGEACAALGRLAGGEALETLQAEAREETDPDVLEKLALALQGWPRNAAAGGTLLHLFDRAGDAQVRRAVLYAAAGASWPQRADLIRRAFAAPDEGVLGVALEALVRQPAPELSESLLSLPDAYEAAPPGLVDALGVLGDARAIPHLLRWLARERNAAVRLKLAFALERIGGHDACQAIVRLLAAETDPLAAEHLAGLAGRAAMVEAIPHLMGLAEDATAPLAVRLQAIASFGRFDDPRVREALARLSRQLHGHGDDRGAPGASSMPAEVRERMRVFVAMARLRLGEPGAEAEVQHLFDTGTPGAHLDVLLLLEAARRDHPVILQGLDSVDFIVLLAAVRAAGAADPKKYAGRLRAIRESPFVASMLASGIDSLNLRASLDEAIGAVPASGGTLEGKKAGKDEALGK